MAISTSKNLEQANGTLVQRINYKPALALLTSLFFMWGFITCLNDILIPHLKSLFELNYTRIMLIQFTFFGAYAIMSLPAGWVVGKIGYKSGIVLGLVVTGIGALMFYPASVLISYGVFLTGFFILATGITILQVAANPFVAILGAPETASGRLNMTQAFNSLGTTIAPVFGGLLILSNHTVAAEKAATVQIPYIGIALALFVIAMVFAFAKLPNIKAESQEKAAGSAWAYPHLVLGAIAIFLYVGGEVSIGSFLINFFKEPDIAGLVETEGAKYVAMYWGGAMIGRFLGAISLTGIKKQSTRYMLYAATMVFAFFLAWYLTKETTLAALFLVFVVINLAGFFFGKNKPSRTLSIMAGIVVILVTVTVISSGKFAMWPIIAVGLFNSIMFPTIFTLAINGLGKNTSQGSGILCMAIVGGAIVPLLMGVLADHFGIHHSFLITLICYLYILFYGIRGYKHQIQ
ncbi:MAG: sugar MFS transporter [Lentimicrobiaceae bacterium]|nr:sugar MFS transporter [Lentimicrobiaceae bacterium]